MSKEQQKSYYERVTKPARAAQRAETLARLGLPSTRPQARKYERSGRDMRLNLRFTGELQQFIEQQSSLVGFQRWFEQLVQEEISRSGQKS